MIAHITTTLAQATYYGGYDAYYGNSGSMGGMYSGVTLIGLAILVISMLVGGAVQMGLKNAFSKEYEDYMADYTVTKPTYDEDEESSDIYDALFGKEVE